MPYRAELKRPDLKGQFPCSVCGKVFCHSSSLSRHRMQAHFKSYTCTQCNQEISSNETLRSHMFRMHAISRMFMCRCCNWAFPDKTSLHIHMQSMLRNGHPGDVAVLARSSTEDGPSFSPSSSPQFGADSLLKGAGGSGVPAQPSSSIAFGSNLLKADATSASAATLPPNLSIFPGLQRQNDVFSRLNSYQKDAASSSAVGGLPLNANQWLTAWLANNPFVAGMGAAGLQQSPLLAAAAAAAAAAANSANISSDIKKEDHHSDEDDYIEINNEDEKEDEEEDEMMAVDGEEQKKENSEPGDADSRPNKRKATRPQQLAEEEEQKAAQAEAAAAVAVPAAETLKISPMEGAGGLRDKAAALLSPRQEQPSPTVSDSHTSSGSSAAGHPGLESPHKCFDCQMLKNKLSLSEELLRQRGVEVVTLKNTVEVLQKQLASYADAAKRSELQALQASNMAMLRQLQATGVMPGAMGQLQQQQNDGMKKLVEQLMQNALASQQRC